MILGVWIAAFIGAFPVFFIVVINRLELPSGEEWNYPHTDWFGNVTINYQTIIDAEFCALDMSNTEASQTFILCAFFIFFLFPAIVIMAVYLHILYKIHQTDQSLGVEHQSKVRNRRSLIRMLATVVIIFFICWIPFHAQRLISIFFPNVEPSDHVLSIISAFLFYVSGNSTVRRV
jgi:hypothetical protein